MSKEWDEVLSACATIENALGELWENQTRGTGQRLKTLAAQNVAEQLTRLCQALAAADEPRDEAYERAAARYDGTGKDWR